MSTTPKIDFALEMALWVLALGMMMLVSGMAKQIGKLNDDVKELKAKIETRTGPER